MKDGIIEESISPWRAQPLVVSNENNKKRMVIDYSQTINRFTLLDAYPLPRIEEVVNRVAQYSVYSSIDLKEAYHQVPIRDDEKAYTAFEANGKLYQFRRIPFGVTNGVACFQRIIDKIINDENLQDTFPYVDDVTVCGVSQEAHDRNLERFLNAAKRYNLSLNENKCVFSATTINLLGYKITQGTIQPDPERLRPLTNLPVPHSTNELKRVLGMFSYYSRWIPKFADKIRPLVKTQNFPMDTLAVKAFEQLKTDVASSVVQSIDESSPFTVETDASDFAIGASLSQSDRPVAFFSRTLSKCEQRYSAVEKEAQAIIEALRKWKHYLIGRHFKLVTDQKSVAFMLDRKHTNKIKNDKIMRWRLEMSCFQFDVVYRAGRENQVADTMSRICASIEEPSGKTI